MEDDFEIDNGEHTCDCDCYVCDCHDYLNDSSTESEDECLCDFCYYRLEEDQYVDEEDVFECQVEDGFISCLDIDFYIYDGIYHNFDDDEEWQFFLNRFGDKVFSLLLASEHEISCEDCVRAVDSEEELILFWCRYCMERNLVVWKINLHLILKTLKNIEEELGILYPHITIPISHSFFNYLHYRGILNQLYASSTRARIMLLLSGDVETNPGPVYITDQDNYDYIQYQDFLAEHIDSNIVYFFLCMQSYILLLCLLNYTHNLYSLMLIYLSGDIELNPGPCFSRPIILCNNNPKRLLLENELNIMVQDLIRKLRWFEKKNIYPQGVLDNVMGVSKINDFIEHALPIMHAGLLNGIGSFLHGLHVIKEDVFQLTIFSLLIILLLSTQAYKSAIISILLFLCYHYAYPSEIINIVLELKNTLNTSKIVIQGVEDFVYNPIFVACGKILFIISGFIAVKSIPGKKDWDSFLLRLDRLPKAKEGAEKISEYAVSLWNLVHEQIKMFILGKTKEELRMCVDIYSQIDDWAKEVRKYIELEERNKIDGDLMIANHVENLYVKGLEFQKEINLSRDAQRLISTHILPAKVLYEYVSLSPVKGGGPRMKPICIWLIGASGVGKTEMIYPLCIDFLRKMGLIGKQIFHNQVYPRQVETEFYDGYNQQRIVVYDDAFQKKDDKVNGNLEIFEVIRSCNTFPQHLHMAALQEKNTFSKAEVMIYTTNESNVLLESITYPDAFFNRMYENAYVVKPKKEFADNYYDKGGNLCYRLNQEKVKNLKGINLDVYLFEKITRDSDGNIVYSGEDLDFSTFSEKMCNLWFEKKNLSLSKLKFLEDYSIRPQGLFSYLRSYIDVWYDASPRDFSRSYFDNLLKEGYDSGKSLAEIEFALAKDPECFEHYIKYSMKLEESKWTEFRKACIDSYKSFEYNLEKGIAEGKRILSNNSFITAMGIVTLTVSGMFLTLWAANVLSDDDDSDNIYDDPNIDKYCVDAEILDSGNPKQLKHSRVRIECENEDKSMNKFKNHIQNQGCNDEVSHSLMTSIIRKNTYSLSFIVNGVEKRCGNVTFIRGWSFIMPYHYLVHMVAQNKDLNALVYLSQDNLQRVIQFSLGHIISSFTKETNEVCGNFNLTKNVVHLSFKDNSKMDCVVVNLYKQMCHIHKDILKHFITVDEQSMLIGRTCGAFVTYQVENNKDLSRVYQWVRDIKPNDQVIEIVFPSKSDCSSVSYMQRESYIYSAPTSKGDCGSVIGVYNPRLVHKLIAMHVAGDKRNCGYALPLYQERLRTALECFDISAQMYYECDQQIDDTKEVCLPKGQFIALGKLGKYVGQNSKTSLVRSILYNKIKKSIMAPAILRPTFVSGELINPLYQGLEKCGKIPIFMSQLSLEVCKLDVQRVVLTQYNNNISVTTYRKVFSFEEAVRGVNDEFMTAICRTTSPGYPYMLENNGQPGKTKWLGKNENFNLDSKDALSLKEDVNNLINNCRKGIISGVYCVDTLKDEKRLIEKVLLAKTRVFSACPQNFVLAFRQYFLGFAAWIMHNRIDNEIAIGTNVYSFDWHRIAQRVQQKGKFIVAGDFTNFDGSLNSQILWSILEIINEWYNDSEENKLIRCGLWCHIVNSVHIKDDDVYMWTHSQPSGNPFTTIINSMYNSIIKRLAWYNIMKEEKKENMEYFNKYVSFISYGDDDIINISSEVINKFNQQTISKALFLLGHIYTDESKVEDEVVRYRYLQDIHFLKRSFKFSDYLMRYIAPLKKDVIYEMLNWTRNDIDPNEVLMDNINTAAREMVLHGQRAFDQYVKEIQQFRDILPRQPMIGSYYQYLLDIEANEDCRVE